LAIIFAPSLLFRLLRMAPPNYTPLWQVVGMFVLVYAPAYWWAGRRPSTHRHLIVIGLLGKIFGPLGFAWSLMRGELSAVFGLTIVTNDLIWWPAFALFLRAAAREHGGWTALLRGD